MFFWKDALIGDGNQRGDFPEEGPGRWQVDQHFRRPHKLLDYKVLISFFKKRGVYQLVPCILKIERQPLQPADVVNSHPLSVRPGSEGQKVAQIMPFQQLTNSEEPEQYR